MGKIKFKAIISHGFLIFIGFYFMSCVEMNTAPTGSFSKNGNATMNKQTTAIYYDFEDICIPMGLTIVPERTKFSRYSGKTIGNMTLKGRVAGHSLYNFFDVNMQKDNWKMISALKSSGATLIIYFKENRISVIGIFNEQIYTYVKIAVMPQQENLTSLEEFPEIISNKKLSGKKSNKMTAVYYDFNDVLIPMELKVIKNRTVIVNTPGFASGIMTLKSNVEEKPLSQFFYNNMQKDNWALLSSLNMADRIIQVYIKEGRAALIEIESVSSTTYTIIGTAPSIKQPNNDTIAGKSTFSDSESSKSKSSAKEINQKAKNIQVDSKPEYSVAPDIKAPLITIISPVSKTAKIKVDQKKITLKGQAADSSGVYEVKVNGVEAQLGDNGLFVANVRLAVGENKVVITALDIKNNISDKTIYIHRQPSIKEPIKTKNTVVTKKLFYDRNNNFALLIACEQYQQNRVEDLRKPVEDAEALKNILQTSYSFPAANITLLKNPSRNKILNELDNLSNLLDQNSRLLIFYAGHAIWDNKLKQGYWLPVDAKVDRKGAWIPNSTIRDYIRGIPSKHTLLISDACFSGGIFKTRKVIVNSGIAYSKLDTLISKKAITSGTLNEVPDDSVFMKYLLMRLNDNKKEMITSEELFFSIRTAVINNSPIHQVPQFGVIRETGDEGGEFVFIKK